jgi:hypothetical protein
MSAKRIIDLINEKFSWRQILNVLTNSASSIFFNVSRLKYGKLGIVLGNFNAVGVCILLLSLAPQPSLGLGVLHKIRLNFLEASQQFSFLQGRVVSPVPNPHPGGPGLCIYIPQRQGGYPF